MKKDIARREFLKLKLDGYSYPACQKELSRRHTLRQALRSNNDGRIASIRAIGIYVISRIELADSFMANILEAEL